MPTANGIRVRCRYTQCRPSRSSARSAAPRRPRAAPAAGGGSSTRTPASNTADTRYDTASTRIVSGAPRVETSAPPSAGPAVCPTAAVPSSRELARGRPSLGTSRGRKDWWAASPISESIPNAAITRASSGTPSRPRNASNGISTRSAPRPPSMATSSGRRWTRSTITPTRTPKSRYGTQRAALTSPRSVAEPPMASTRSGTATTVTWVPAPDTAVAAQKRPNHGPAADPSSPTRAPCRRPVRSVPHPGGWTDLRSFVGSVPYVPAMPAAQASAERPQVPEAGPARTGGVRPAQGGYRPPPPAWCVICTSG